MTDGPTHASFFSGVGGLDLGLERAGWRTVSFSEIDPYASAVLTERWPGVAQLGDITLDRATAHGRPGMTPHYADLWLTVYHGDALEVLAELPAGSVHCVVTSPPYWGLRDYGVPGQLGLEPTPEEYVERMVDVFREVRRVLRDDGTLWLNIGDSYAANRTYQVPSTKGGPKHAPAQGFDGSVMTVPPGLKPKDLVGIPWRLAFALQADGWYLRSDVIWSKPNPMPESVTDRPTKSHEYLFLLSKRARYYYDAAAAREASVGANDHDLSGGGYTTTPPGQRPQTGNRARYKMPDGWDTGPGGHGSYHRDGREKGARPLKQDLAAATASPSTQRRMTGFNERWSAKERALGEKFAASPVDARASASARFGRGAGWRDVEGTRPPARNLRSVWTIATQPYRGAHFATFPEALVEPCITAGTSARGVCPDCGAPWVRETTVEYVKSPVHGNGSVAGRHYETGANNYDGGGMPRLNKRVETTGWCPTCKHEVEPVPAVVLDPFGGSGTVALVAERLQRKAVLIELNEEYIGQALERVAQGRREGTGAPVDLALPDAPDGLWADMETA